MISNGTGLYCRGCAVLVEAVHEQLLATRHRWNEPGFKIQTRDYLKKFCAASESRGDEDNIAQACPFLSTSYAGIIGSRHFGRSVPTEPGLYTRISRVCVDELGMCYAPETPPAALVGKKAARCTAISTLLADMHDVYTRRDVSRASFRAVPHARAVVEGTCAQLARRFPPGKALRALEEACDALVEEHEEALARFLSGGTRAEGALAGCDLGSVAPWRSPWATRSAVGAAKEAVERNETAPSELVKRLIAYGSEQVLDAEVDPEGWGPAANGQQQQQQQQPGGRPRQKKRGKKGKPRKGTGHAEL